MCLLLILGSAEERNNTCVIAPANKDRNQYNLLFREALKKIGEREYELLPDLYSLPFADYLKPLVLLSLNTGARQGELFRLHWEDIDFDRKSIALVMRGKRKSHTRHIPLNK